MKKSLGSIPALFPMPVLMLSTYSEGEHVNVMNAAWSTLCEEDIILIVLDPKHKTVENIKKRSAFCVALPTAEQLEVADFFGIASGNKMPDKFSKTGLSAHKSPHVDAPIVEEFPVTMECSLLEILDNPHFFGVLGRIVNTSAEESLLDEKGKIEAAKINGVLFDQMGYGYYGIGERLGKAWGAGVELYRQAKAEEKQ